MANTTLRLLLISNHLKEAYRVDKDALFGVYFDEAAQQIKDLRKRAIESPYFNPNDELYIHYEKTRELTLNRIATLYDKKNRTLEDDLKNPLNKLSMLYVFSEYDKATTTRLVVHNILFVDSLQTLGTQKHQNEIKRAYSLENYGCFAMTELGHGSNVLSLETTATYLHESREFEIHSPTATSAKWWIGAAGKTANVAIVFAQLIIGKESKGVHAFYFPIRDSNHMTYPGVTVGDCGPKISLNSVDNGFLLFSHYRVGYDSLLDRFSGITADGKFKSAIKNDEKRFATMLAGLIRGRLSVVSSAEISVRSSLTIAYRFVSSSFQESSRPGTRLIDLQIIYTKIVPCLSNLIAIRSGLRYMLKIYQSSSKIFLDSPDGENISEYHMFISAVKPTASWMADEIISNLLDICGIHGSYLRNSIARIKNNQDINVTWEGDNSVLIQQVSKSVFKQIRNTMKGSPVTSNLLKEAFIPQNTFFVFNMLDVKEFNTTELMACLKYLFNYFTFKSLEKLQNNAGKFESIIEAWNKSQIFCIQEVGKSLAMYLFAVSFKEFCEEVRGKSEETARVLGKILDVFLLDKIIKGSSFLLEGCLGVRQVEMLKEQFVGLCCGVREEGLEVIEALAPPDELLYSEIGEKRGEIIDRIYEGALGVPSKLG